MLALRQSAAIFIVLFLQEYLTIRTCYTQDGPAGPTLFLLFAGQQLNILGSQHVDLYWRQVCKLRQFSSESTRNRAQYKLYVRYRVVQNYREYQRVGENGWKLYDPVFKYRFVKLGCEHYGKSRTSTKSHGILRPNQSCVSFSFIVS